MFGSAILDVAIGVIFSFLAISLFTSALTESFNSLVGLRANTLKAGVQKLLNDPNFKGLAQQLYAHALINPLGPGASAPAKNKPSYIDSAQFASALLDVAKVKAPAAVANLRATITNEITDKQISEFLLGVVDRASGDIEQMKTEIAAWFDAAMDRLGGQFKRWQQLICFGIALSGAILFNLDAIRIAKTLWANPSLVNNLQAASLDKQIANDDAKGVQDAVRLVNQMMEQRLPAGWPPGRFLHLSQDDQPDRCQKNDASCLPKKSWWAFRAPLSILLPSVLGWLVTAVAALFGAPFWFDALQSIVRVRGTGLSPDERKTQDAKSS